MLIPHRAQQSGSRLRPRLAPRDRDGVGSGLAQAAALLNLGEKRRNICSQFVWVGDGGGGLLRGVTERQCAGAWERGNPERIFQELHIKRNSGAPYSALFQAPRDPPWKQARCRSQEVLSNFYSDQQNNSYSFLPSLSW